jgi:hypothetical protein
MYSPKGMIVYLKINKTQTYKSSDLVVNVRTLKWFKK